MNAILGYAALNCSAQGVDGEFSRAAKAAERIARVGATAAPDTVSVSAEALARTREQGNTAGGDLDRPLIDLRVARYAAIANLQVVRTADEVAKVTTDIVDPGGEGRVRS